MTSPNEILDRVKSTLKERGRAYDRTKRSAIDDAVEVYRTITGNPFTVREALAFMSALKLVRTFRKMDDIHTDSIIDNIAYSAMLGAHIENEKLQDITYNTGARGQEPGANTITNTRQLCI